MAWDPEDLKYSHEIASQGEKEKANKEDWTEKLVRKEGRKDTRKQRAKLLMDQKANSIADLAWVLEEQNKAREEFLAKLAAHEEDHSNYQRGKITEYYKKSQDGGLEKLDKRIASVTGKLERLLKAREEGAATGAERPSVKARDELITLRRKLIKQRKEMVAAVQAYESAVADATAAAEEQSEKGELAPGEQELTYEVNIDVPEIFRWKPERFGLDAPKRSKDRRWKKVKSLIQDEKLFATEGVKIRWTDIIDSGFAKSWPEDIEHDNMEILGHAPAAPKHSDAEFSQTLAERAVKRYQSVETVKKTVHEVVEVGPNEELGEGVETFEKEDQPGKRFKRVSETIKAPRLMLIGLHGDTTKLAYQVAAAISREGLPTQVVKLSTTDVKYAASLLQMLREHTAQVKVHSARQRLRGERIDLYKEPLHVGGAHGEPLQALNPHAKVIIIKTKRSQNLISDEKRLAPFNDLLDERWYNCTDLAEAYTEGLPAGRLHYKENRSVTDAVNDLWLGEKERQQSVEKLYEKGMPHVDVAFAFKNKFNLLVQEPIKRVRKAQKVASAREVVPEAEGTTLAEASA